MSCGQEEDGRWTQARGRLGRKVLPRKEVIQPQVPLRLPCYDFTPLAEDTFGALFGRLQVPPTRLV